MILTLDYQKYKCWIRTVYFVLFSFSITIASNINHQTWAEYLEIVFVIVILWNKPVQKLKTLKSFLLIPQICRKRS